jgi:DNA-binding Lrp family transcriptional regulator
VRHQPLIGVDERCHHARVIPNLYAVYDVMGETYTMVIAKFKSRCSLSDFTKKFLSMPYIERTNTHVVLTTMKEDFRMASDI